MERGEYIVQNKATVRGAAKKFGAGKSTGTSINLHSRKIEKKPGIPLLSKRKTEIPGFYFSVSSWNL